jgi:hypothetical protein
MDEERQINNVQEQLQQLQLQQQQQLQHQQLLLQQIMQQRAQAEAQPQPELLNEGEYNPGHENCSAVVQCFV